MSSAALKGGEEENCWGAGRAILDSFSRAYPERAEDLDMHAVNFARIARYINGPVASAILALANSDADKAKKAIKDKLVTCLNKDHAEPFNEKKKEYFEGIATNKALLLDLHKNLAQLLDYDTVTTRTANAREYYGRQQGF